MLRPEPQTRQEWVFYAWAGTPYELAASIDAIGNAMPDGMSSFKATVRLKGRAPLSADAPEGLRETPTDGTVKGVRAEMTGFREGGLRSENYSFVIVGLSITSAANSVAVGAPTEPEARMLMGAARDAITPNVPARARILRKVGFESLLGIVPALALSIGAVLIVQALTDSATAALYSGFFAWLPLAALSFRVADWLVTPFELHTGKTRIRRFAYQVVALVLAPLAIGALLLLLVD